MIFDEIDTGISGKVATGVSKKIHEISKSSQTLVITHLPQVSAIGEHHYFVSKYVEDGFTKTKINKLNEEEVINNIAYMMTGEEQTKESLALAKQLIESLK
jgi:DNA repair protein RecN (Recombination protein N)